MAKITQLYEKLELFSDGDPVRHTLFVLAQLLGTPDRLLLIDPPDDAVSRFSLAENSAILFTGQPTEEARAHFKTAGIQQIETKPGGVAHISVGEHLLDIYSQAHSNLVLLPAVGVLMSGDYGSDLSLPILAPGSNGSEELDTLRLLARLVRQRPPQLMVSRIGSLARDTMSIMERLANDVAYLNGLQRVLPELAKKGEPMSRVQQIGQTLLPEKRRTPHAQTIHRQNVERLFQAARLSGSSNGATH